MSVERFDVEGALREQYERTPVATAPNKPRGRTTNDVLGLEALDFDAAFVAPTVPATIVRAGGAGVYVSEAFAGESRYTELLNWSPLASARRLAFVCADCGAGKTVAFVSVAAAAMIAGQRVLVVVPRQALADQLYEVIGEKTNRPGLHYKNADRMRETTHDYFVTTVDSLHAIMVDGEYGGGFGCVIFDEVSLIVSHALVGSTLDRTSNSRLVAIGLLRAVVEHATISVFCDKDVRAVEVDFVAKAASGYASATLFKLTSTRKVNLMYVDKKEAFVAAVDVSLEQGRRLAIFVPSQQVFIFYFFCFSSPNANAYTDSACVGRVLC